MIESECPQVVHLELHTSDREASSRFYSDLLQWRTDRIDTNWGSYHARRAAAPASGEIALWQPKPQLRKLA